MPVFLYVCAQTTRVKVCLKYLRTNVQVKIDMKTAHYHVAQLNLRYLMKIAFLLSPDVFPRNSPCDVQLKIMFQAMTTS